MCMYLDDIQDTIRHPNGANIVLFSSHYDEADQNNRLLYLFLHWEDLEGHLVCDGFRAYLLLPLHLHLHFHKKVETLYSTVCLDNHHRFPSLYTAQCYHYTYKTILLPTHHFCHLLAL